MISAILLLASVALAQDHGSEAAGTMGPVAFMWPDDREWGASQDNTAPCGSAARVTNRTDFPLLNGAVALVAQDESWSIQLAISYNNEPTSNDDFEVLIDGARIAELSEGHECYPVPNPGPDVEAGANATLQIRYTSDFDEGVNSTFYACADIRYVLTSQFTYQIPCFNATVDDFDIVDVDNPEETSSTDGADTSESPEVTDSGSDGLSGGAIAGIVIGAIGGVALFAIAAFLLWRRRQQQQRRRAHEQSVRNVKWNETDAASSASSGGHKDVPLETIRR